MNELLQQLMQLGPGIVQGLRGNGPAMQAFLQSYHQTQFQMDQQERQRKMDALSQQDRTRQITRQESADRIAQEDRARKMELEKLQVMPTLAEMGGTGETPDDAKHIIETAIPGLMKVFGQDTMAYGMPAIEMATRTITARQKRQVGEFVEKALKTAYVADNPDADPVIQNLPEHVSKALGKPTAKLSELQQFAQLPVGKPQGKERMPAAAGSFEDFSTADPARKQQILADRKAYMQSDDKPTVNLTLPGGISTKAGDAALKFQDDYARDSKPYVTMRDAYQRVKSAAARPDAAGDLSMIFAYMKMLDPNSVVREQEFANAQNAAGVPDRIRNVYNRVVEGTRLTPEQRTQFEGQADALFENAMTNQRGVRKTYGDRAKQWGVPDSMVLDAEDEFLSGKAPKTRRAATPTTTGPQVGTRRKINGVLAEWDGKGWLPVVK